MISLKPGDVHAGGVRMGNHLVLAAGILGTTGASLSRVLASGAGCVVTKSIGPYLNEGHKGPCFFETTHGLMNAMGLPNPSKEFVAELAGLAGKPVVVSVYGGNPEEFAEVASWFHRHAAGIELNLSCPHAEGYGAALGSDPKMVEMCTRAVKELGIPVWVKLTPNVTDIGACGLAAERGGADAIVAINTVKAMRISTELRKPVLGNRFGGLSGPAVFPVAVRCVYELYQVCKIPIIGCGGISSAHDVIEMMMAGASAVQIGSAVIDNDQVFETIRNDLYSPDGESPKEIIGCAHE
ncbi:MAG TPA: dihydroorotate dehydrogenase [Methanoregulaceae archaeon]|nr:dihydroorotate dehydrogenase [Methanoregulaceae archaeon]